MEKIIAAITEHYVIDGSFRLEIQLWLLSLLIAVMFWFIAFFGAKMVKACWLFCFNRSFKRDDV